MAKNFINQVQIVHNNKAKETKENFEIKKAKKTCLNNGGTTKEQGE